MDAWMDGWMDGSRTVRATGEGVLHPGNWGQASLRRGHGDSPQGESKPWISGTDIPGRENEAPLMALRWELAWRPQEQQWGGERRR